MREIKFRFYSKDAGQYAQVKSVDLGGDFFTVRYLGKNHHIDGIGQLEQFTGLRDKNDKEIYEGDILQNEAGGHSPVVYRYGGFFVELVDCEEFGTMYVPLNEAILFAEIIGNIHENPELLEVTK